MDLTKKLKFLFILVCFNSNAQQKTGIDFEHIFKNWIYIEKTSNLIIDKYAMKSLTIKNDSVFKIFKENIKLKILNVKSNLPSNYEVKSLLLNNENVLDIAPNLTPYNLSINSFAYSPQCDGKLVLIFNTDTGMSFRINGFNANDCLSFLSDLKNTLYHKLGKEYKRNKLLKDYYIESIDLKCIFEGVIDEKFSNYYKKYPCLKSCLDPIIVE